MNMLLKWILFALLIMLIAWIIPGISITNFWMAMIAVIVIGLVNIFIRPLINFISLPLNMLTLGLFSLVINALLLILVAKFSPGFQIDGFWSGFFGAILLSFLAPIVDKISINRG